MKGTRTKVDFSKHILEHTESKEPIFVSVHHFHKPGTIAGSIKFINIDGKLLVTGDYGSYVFCRGFYPSAESEKVSGGYWLEKIRQSSIQKPCSYDADETIESLKEAISNVPENYSDQDKIEKATEYYNDCLCHTEDEWEYIEYARSNMPDFMNHEDMVVGYKLHEQLAVVFDAYDIIIDIYKSKNPA